MKKKNKAKGGVQAPGNSSASNPFQIEWPQVGGNKLVGAYIPRQLADYINLLAMYRKTTTSQLIRDQIGKMVEDATPEQEMIDSLIDSAVVEWQTRMEANEGKEGWEDHLDILARYREYQQEIRLMLVKRSISDALILRIIKKFEIIQGGV